VTPRAEASASAKELCKVLQPSVAKIEEIVKGGLPAFFSHEGAPQLQIASDELTAKRST
jgi:hypothetical protein